MPVILLDDTQSGHVPSVPPSSTPRRTSSRLAQASPASLWQGDNRKEKSATAKGSTHPNILHVNIPSEKTTSHYSVSSASNEDNSGEDGIGESYTPATSVHVTPVGGPDTSKPQRVSASARARELRSSALSLNNGNTQKALKRNSTTANLSLDGDSKFGNPDADAALAHDLQLQEYQNQEYQNPPKRFKPFGLEVQDSAHEESSGSDIAEFDQVTGKESWKYRSPPGKRRTLGQNKKAKKGNLPKNETPDESDLGYDSYESFDMPSFDSDLPDDSSNDSSSDSDAIFGMPVLYPPSRNGSIRRPHLAAPRRLTSYDRLLEGVSRRVS